MDIILKKHIKCPFLLYKKPQFNLSEHQLVLTSEQTGYYVLAYGRNETRSKAIVYCVWYTDTPGIVPTIFAVMLLDI